MRYNVARKTARALTSAGYLNPAYSRDGKYVAATKTTTFGTNVVILDGTTGQEILRLTDDDASFAPTWSPAGDGVAYLHLNGQTVDLRLAKLDGTAPAWTVKETIDLTEVSDLGPESRPDWFIPADQLPALPTPTPAPSVVAPSASTAP
jgi:Tol biopolymer transport system component